MTWSLKVQHTQLTPTTPSKSRPSDQLQKRPHEQRTLKITKVTVPGRGVVRVNQNNILALSFPWCELR